MEGMAYCRALFSVASAINSSLDPSAVLQAVVQNAAEAMNAKGCSLMLLSADRKELRHSASHGLSDSYIRKGPLNADLSIPEALKGRAVAILDAGTDHRVQYRPQAVQEGIRSMLSVPVRLRTDVIGVMRIYAGERREFSPEDIEFVEAIADLGAIALENARRHTRAQTDLLALEEYIRGGYIGAG
jgi:GAF domain-containing protein